MNIFTRLLIISLMFSFTSCSWKSGANIQSQVEHSDSMHEKEDFSATETKQNTETSQGLLPGSVSVAESFQVEMFYSTDTDRVIFDDYIAYIKPFKSQQISRLIIETARFFMNKPYIASTLEFEPEGLVINLRELDCTTLVETVLALSRTVKIFDNPTFENFGEQLQNVRYRRGNIGDYTDRNHYFSDWIYENETRGYVKDVTKEAGGEPYKMNLNFMSSHPDSYKQLKSNPGFVDIIRKKESEISDRNVYSIIPEARIKSCEKEMMDGDIVCFVTDIEGLDVSHIGFIYRDKGVVTFIHASSSAKKVIVNPQELLAYVEKNKRNTGVIIVRPMFYD